MITTLISSENFWIVLSMILLFIVLVFIVSSGNEETKIRLITEKDNKEVDGEVAATILIGISLCLPAFITACFFIFQRLISDQTNIQENNYLNIYSYTLALVMTVLTSLVCAFLIGFIFMILSVLSYILLNWQESFKTVRKHNKFMFANITLIASIIFSLFVCFTLLPMNNIYIVILASSIPSLYLYCQEIFFIRKNLKAKQ